MSRVLDTGHGVGLTQKVADTVPEAAAAAADAVPEAVAAEISPSERLSAEGLSR